MVLHTEAHVTGTQGRNHGLECKSQGQQKLKLLSEIQAGILAHHLVFVATGGQYQD